MWLSLRPDWKLLYSHMYTDWPGIHNYEEINDRLFVNPGRNDNIHDTPSKAKWNAPAHLYYWLFFCLEAAWLNGIRCPGGRPSVS